MTTIMEKIRSFFNRWLKKISGVALVGITVITVTDIILRQVYRPFEGTVEISCFLTAALIGISLGNTQIKRGHITVDIIVSRFSHRLQNIIAAISYFISTVLFGLAAWQITLYATHIWRIGSLSETLKLIYFPFIYSVAFGCAYLTFVLFVDILKSLGEVFKK
jgi:TRAP-type C4-dicarboxylate transport system permease small subunit